MGWAIIPKPGAKYGPCVAQCKHEDCAWQRKTAAAKCGICGKPIGYDTRYYANDEYMVPGVVPESANSRWVHAICMEDKVDAEQAAREGSAHGPDDPQ